MTNNEYKTKCIRTLPDLGHNLNLCHMVLGLSGEIGELVSCVGTELKIKIDRVNLGEELGDLYWYLTNYCNIQNLPVPEEPTTSLPNDVCLDLLITSVSDLVDTVKRLIAYNKPIERTKELEITYNIYVALSLFEKAYDIDGESIRKKNIEKLMVRYPEKFTNELALNRDTTAERKKLEE